MVMRAKKQVKPTRMRALQPTRLYLMPYVTSMNSAMLYVRPVTVMYSFVTVPSCEPMSPWIAHATGLR